MKDGRSELVDRALDERGALAAVNGGQVRYPINVVLFASFVQGCATGPPTDSGGNTDWLWIVPASGAAITPALDASGALMFAVSATRDVVAIETDNGRVKWRTSIGQGAAFGENIAVAGDVVAVGDVDVVGLRVSSGAILWRFSRPGGEEGARTIWSDGTSFFLAGFDGQVSRIEAETGRVLWMKSLSRGDTVSAFGPAVYRDILFVCANRYGALQRGTLFALDSRTGTNIWNFDYVPELPGQSSKCVGRVIEIGNLIVSTQYDGRVFAHDRATGGVVWISTRVHSPPGDPNGPGTGPYDDQRFVGSDGQRLIVTSDNGTVVSLDPSSGKQLWKSKTLGTPIDPPALGTSRVVINHGGFAVAYDLDTGGRLWTRPLDEPLVGVSPEFGGGPVIRNDVVYLVGSKGFKARRLD